jgi:hypothetical protein
VTEAEWLACIEPEPMLAFLDGKASDRKLRLFAVACCRRSLFLPLWNSGEWGEPSRRAVTIVEQLADGLVDAEAVRAASQGGLYRPAACAIACRRGEPVGSAAGQTAVIVRNEIAVWARFHVPGVRNVIDKTVATEAAIQTRFLRCIFGPVLYRQVALPRAVLTWNHGTVPAIARRIYDERAFHDMPILADALEDAGCTDRDLVGHCRRTRDSFPVRCAIDRDITAWTGPPEQHVRGCWVVDLLLSRE